MPSVPTRNLLKHWAEIDTFWKNSKAILGNDDVVGRFSKWMNLQVGMQDSQSQNPKTNKQTNN